jgi:hypothetical protein
MRPQDNSVALSLLQKALALDPGYAWAFAGDLVQAGEQLERVRRLNPADPAAFMFISA